MKYADEPWNREAVRLPAKPCPESLIDRIERESSDKKSERDGIRKQLARPHARLVTPRQRFTTNPRDVIASHLRW